MIIDCISNAKQYFDVHPFLKKAFEWIKSIDFNSIKNDVYEIEGKIIFAIVNQNAMKEKAYAQLEIHRKYIDIQIPLSKEETIGWKTTSTLKDMSATYDEEKDFALFADAPTSFVTLQPQQFVVFFPEDAHAPLIGEGNIRKIVIKVAV